jgi:hypothetical protein
MENERAFYELHSQLLKTTGVWILGTPGSDFLPLSLVVPPTAGC